MKSNTIVAFVLIILTITFFNSSFYYDKILKRESPAKVAERQRAATKALALSDSIATANKQATPTAPVLQQQPSALLGVNSNKSAVPTIIDSSIIAGDTITVETDKLICKISSIGARIVSVKTKGFYLNRLNKKPKPQDELVELLFDGQRGGANLTINGETFDSKSFKSKNTENSIKISKNESDTVVCFLVASWGDTVYKKFVFSGDSYKIGLNIVSNSLSGKATLVGWTGGLKETELAVAGMPGQQEQKFQRKVHFSDGKSTESFQTAKIEQEERTGDYRWIGETSKYFTVVVGADSTTDGELIFASYDEEATVNTVDGKKKPSKNINYNFAIRGTAEKASQSFWIYAGPSKIEELTKYNIKLEKVLFNGWTWFVRADLWFPIICEWTLWLLLFLFKYTHDWGVAIILITVILKAITFPLTQSSMKSMSRMKDLQPKIAALRAKYKSDPKKLNEKTMAMYKEEGVNPFNLGGCLPIFLQMPILFALFIVLQRAIELRGATTIMIPWVLDLSQAEVFFSFKQWLPGGIPMYGDSIALMPIIMAVLTFFQQKMTIKDPNQKAMIYIMPIFMLFMFNAFPSGLVLYWTFSTALAIVQQWYLDSAQKKTQAAAAATVVVQNINKR